MSRQLAKTTLDRFRSRLEEERSRLEELIEEARLELEEARQTESSAERSSDPGDAEAGSMKFEYEKELSIEQNNLDLLHKIERALQRIDQGIYGSCESCGTDIPVARLDALPYVVLCVNCARRA